MSVNHFICEKCWNDAYLRLLGGFARDQADAYHELLRERAMNPCSPREQAGQWWDEEHQLDLRLKENR